jgi:hypothetical protein
MDWFKNGRLFFQKKYYDLLTFWVIQAFKNNSQFRNEKIQGLTFQFIWSWGHLTMKNAIPRKIVYI